MPSSLTLSQYLPGLLLAAGVGMLAFIALLNLRARLSRRTSHQSPAREMIDEIKARAQRASRGSVAETRASQTDDDENGVLNEDAATRRLIAQLDVRSKQIERLIHQADRRIEFLHQNRECNAVTSISAADVKNSDEPSIYREAASSGAHTASAPDRTAALVAAHDVNGCDSEPEVEVANELKSAQLKRRPINHRNEESSASSHTAADRLTALVYEYADRGCAPVEIARQLDEHVGKVELILALRNRVGRSMASHS